MGNEEKGGKIRVPLLTSCRFCSGTESQRLVFRSKLSGFRGLFPDSMSEGTVIGQFQQDRVKEWANCRTKAKQASQEIPPPNKRPNHDLQRVWDLAHIVFSGAAGSVPPKREIEVLRAVFGSIPLKDLGIDEGVFRPNCQTGNIGPSKISYLHIKEDKNMSLGIFCLPKGATIPLHDHPGMTVLSRVLYGSMHVKSFDWTNEKEKEAVRVLDCDVTSQDPPLVLFPRSGGNIHSFTAVTPCAVLDLLAPPYLPEDGRDCTYFRECSDLDPGSFSDSSSTKAYKTKLEVCQPNFDIGKL